MRCFKPESYGPAFQSLLEVDRRRALDAGTPDRTARDELKRLSLETAFAHATIIDRDMASCCLSGVWLLHDFLDESHTISQSIETPEGSYWHAIMHRCEGDFSNAKYWLRRVGRHPVIAAVGENVGEFLRNSTRIGETQLRDGEWDPFDFVGQCEAVVRGNRRELDLCLNIQQAEWELLFDFCYRGAIEDSQD